MGLHRFFLEHQVLADEAEGAFLLQLAPDDARHAKVLRLQPGEHIAVVDAASDYFECEVVAVDGGLPTVRIAQRGGQRAEGPQVVLLQGLAKGDKMEEVVRHGTELGVAAFVPLACERSVVRLDAKKASAKVARWQAIAKSAAMQSGQARIPEVEAPRSVAAACEALAGAAAVLVCWEEAPEAAGLRAALGKALGAGGCLAPDARVAVVVGPEGGLAQAEVDALLGCNPCASLVSLGPSILRTETAGVVAPALVLYELGALGGGAEGQRS